MKKFDKTSLRFWSFIIGTGLFGIGGITTDFLFSPKQIYSQKVDLNQDGVSDLIIEQRRGHKIPMYGVEEGDKIKYLSASEMRKRNPDQTINYKIIESKLNSKILSE